jgi:hypothetical protein
LESILEDAAPSIGSLPFGSISQRRQAADGSE